MRNPTEREIKKDIVLSKCFNCLTEKGIEAVTVKDFSEATGMASSSIYYWFEDKDEIVLDAVEWGFRKNINDLFDFAFEHTGNSDELCAGLLQLLQERKISLRLIFQLATSPYYGNKVRTFAGEISKRCEEYTLMLADKMNMQYEEIFPFVNLFISSIVNNVMWDNWGNLKYEMSSIVNKFSEKR